MSSPSSTTFPSSAAGDRIEVVFRPMQQRRRAGKRLPQLQTPHVTCPADATGKVMCKLIQHLISQQKQGLPLCLVLCSCQPVCLRMRACTSLSHYFCLQVWANTHTHAHHSSSPRNFAPQLLPQQQPCSAATSVPHGVELLIEREATMTVVNPRAFLRTVAREHFRWRPDKQLILYYRNK